jgi:pimeloyl-ACP methyl ester carboxylesterase/predicted MFS family arabinose efflux permease
MNDTAEPKASYRAFVLFMLIVVYTLNFVDRQIIGILAIPIQEELGVSDTMIGVMRGVSFALFYSTLGVPIAWLADRANRVWIITAALTVWSAMTATCGLATSSLQLFFARMGVGVGEAGGIAPAYSMITDYYPPNKRARALAIYSFGIPIGGAVGIVFGGVVATLMDWRAAFIMVGVAGVALAPVFFFSMREPLRGRFDGGAKVAGGASIAAVVATLLTKRSFWTLSLGAASSSIMGYGLFAWLPAFFVRSFGDELPSYLSFLPAWMIPDDAGPLLYAAYFYGLIVLVGGVIGLFLGGLAADRLGEKHRGAYATVPAVAFLCTVPLYVLGILSPSLTTIFFVLLVPTALGLAWIGPVVSAFQHIVPMNMRATATAVFLLINNLLGLALGDVIIGALSDGMRGLYGDESLRYSILAGTVFYLIAACFFFLAAPQLKHDWSTPTPLSGGRGGVAAPGDFLESRFTNADGLKLQYRDYAPVGPGTGPPVLCLHGLTRSVRDFEDLAPMFAALGRRVITASQRGRAGSDPDPKPERYNPAVYTQDMLALLNHLGIEQAVFVGTSMGGLMTMIAAATAPQRIAGAVINDIGPEIDPAGLARIQSYVGQGGPMGSWHEAASKCRSINGVAFPKEESEVFWLNFARKICREEAPGRILLDYDPAIARTVAPGSNDIVNLWPLFDALKQIPTLVVRGGITDILMESTVEEMRRRKPDLVVASVPNVGHAPFLTEPEAWAAVRDFVTRA